ncbi:hypothetical protein FQA39_LY09431 [Lamprigera yunnana]|nr:hypothetical protein FQA39_LY09431 [Lamprigera yunnana]
MENPVICGRRIIDLEYFLIALKSLKHEGFGCSFFNLSVLSEKSKGLHSIISFRCSVCNTIETIRTGSSNINLAAVSQTFKMEQSASTSKVASKCSYDGIENLVEDEGSSLLWPPPDGEERQELTDAIYYLRQLLIKHDFIVESEGSEIGERFALIGRDMFKRFLDMYRNLTFTEEEVLFSNWGEEESTLGTNNEETRALKKIKIDEDIIYSDSDGEDNVDGLNRIPYAVKSRP